MHFFRRDKDILVRLARIPADDTKKTPAAAHIGGGSLNAAASI